MDSTFVVGVDGSAASLAALRWAIERARGGGNSRIVIVHAALTPFPPDHTGRTFYCEDEAERYWDDVRAQVEHRYAGYLREAGVPFVLRTVEGAPADVINAVAAREDADVIVLGNARHGAVEELCLGSVAHRVVRETTRPVILVPLTTTPSRAIAEPELVEATA